MDASEIITNYESLSAITGQMREAAIEGKWDQLFNLERQCSLHVSNMKPADKTFLLDESARQIKVSLIKKILDDDAEIRNHTETWMGQLRNIMHSNHQEQRLHQAYGV